MKTRPKIKLTFTIGDKILETAGWIFLLAIWTGTLVSYSGLPHIIPIHYNIAGDVDGFGSKEYILALPIVATVLFIGLTILNKFPHLLNSPTKITDQNALKQYTYITRFVRYLKLIIVIIFGILIFKTIHISMGKGSEIGVWFTPVIILLIFIPLIYFLIRIYRLKK